MTVPALADWDEVSPGERWRREAACRTFPIDPEDHAFFPVRRSKNSQQVARSTEQALRVCCAGCPVAIPCATWAVIHGMVGIWGGMNDDERSVWAGRRDLRPGPAPVFPTLVVPQPE